MPRDLNLASALLVLIGACQFPAYGGHGFTGPRVHENSVSLLFAPTESNGTHEEHVAYQQLSAAMIAALRTDPRVHLEVVDHVPTELHALDNIDYVVELGVSASASQNVQCVILDPGGALRQLFDPFAPQPSCAVTSTGPWIAMASVGIRFANPRAHHVRVNASLSRGFAASKTNSQDWQTLLDAKIAEATTWFAAELPHHFAAEAAIATLGPHTSVKLGTRDGVHADDVFEIYNDKYAEGFARATRVDAATTELERIYGADDYVTGDRAIQRGTAWMLDLDTVFGVRREAVVQAATTTASPAFSVGFHARVHPVSSGLIFGAGFEGVLADHRGFLIGPEVGWGVRLSPNIELHALVDGHIMSGTFEGSTHAGAGTSGVVGTMMSAHHAYVVLEGGYEWTSRFTSNTDAYDYRGPFARLAIGLSLF